MPLTAKEVILLLDNYGRAYFNPSLSQNNRLSFLKVIKKNFPKASVQELSEKLQTLYNQFQQCKKDGNTSWDYYGLVEKVVDLAKSDYESKNNNAPQKTVAEKEVQKAASVKRSADESITVGTSKKNRTKMSDFANNGTDNIDPGKLEEAAIEKVILAVTNFLKKKESETANEFGAHFDTLTEKIQLEVEKESTKLVQTIEENRNESIMIEIKDMLQIIIEEQRKCVENMEKLLAISKDLMEVRDAQEALKQVDNETKQKQVDLFEEVLNQMDMK